MNRAFLPWILLLGLCIAVNPIQWISILVCIILLIYWGFVQFGHPAILFLIAARPTLDLLRTTGIAVQDMYVPGTVLFGAAIIVWSCAIVYTYRSVIRQTGRVRIVSILGTGFLLYSISTLAWSIDPMTTATELLHVVSIILLFLVGAIFIHTRQVSLHTLLSILLIGSIVPIGIGIWQFITDAGIRTFSVQDRIYSTFAHPNVYALYLLTIGCIVWLWYQLQSVRPRWILHIGFPMIGLLLLGTYTRAAWIGAALFLITYGWIQYKRQTLILLTIGISSYLLFFPINQILIRTFNTSLTEYQLIARIFERDAEADSVSWRLSVITDSIPVIRERPLLGFGYGTFGTVWEVRRDPSFRFDDSSEAHNDYLRLWLETGTIGIGLFLLLLLVLLIQSIQTVTAHPSKKEYLIHTFLISWTIMYAALSLSDNMLNHTAVAWTMWLVWGALIASKFEKDHFLA